MKQHCQLGEKPQINPATTNVKRRQKETVAEEIKKSSMTLDDCKMKSLDIADTLKISSKHNINNISLMKI